jgi:hypothetical protein
MATSDRRAETIRQFDRVRARQSPVEQGVFDGNEPSPFHDVLVIGPRQAQDVDEFFRVPVIKVARPLARGSEREGSYVDPPEKFDLYDYSARRTLAFARPQDWSATDATGALGGPRGPAFGTLPVKREPAATACLTCYLVDAQNFTHVNAWTAEEWNNLGDEDLPAAPSVSDEDFEVLIAGPRGQVFHLHVVLADADADPKWTLGSTVKFPNNAGSLQCLDLRNEMEIWNQLRNGVVAGTVIGSSKKRSSGRSNEIPLVNITSLIPPSDPPTPEAQSRAATGALVASYRTSSSATGA